MTTSPPESDQGEQPIDPSWASDELRLALAMRGGVSLAVWIGGATAEIDSLCSAPTPRGFWSRLASAAGYESVIVDVMSGASAGGLNAVIGAAAATYGFSLEALRDTWLELGSLSKMVRTADRSGPGDGLSLLEGDEYFLAELRDRLETLVGSAGTHTPRRIDVTLAATLLEPVSVEQTRNSADTTQLRYMSTFRFRHGSPVWSDFPRDASGRSAALARLALAGRATSSFPAAFEAAAVKAPRPHSFIDFPAPPSDDIEMTGVFGEATATGRMFCVMDGGVLDNIPIARAIDAIVAAPADRPTRRVLIYVQPGSSGTSATAPVDEPDRSTAAVLTAMFRTRVQEETIAGDLRQIEEHNARVRRSRMSATGAVRQLKDSSAVGPPPPSLRYASQRANQEASDVAALLADPIGTLGGDPFPRLPNLEGTFTDRCWRSPLSLVWTPAWAEQFPFELAGELEQRISESISSRGHALTVGVGPLRRLIHLLIDASRALARCEGTLDDEGDPKELKAALYRLLAVHAEIVERPCRWAWVTLAVLRGDEPAWTSGAVGRVEELCAGGDQLGEDFVAYLDNPGPATVPLAAADGVMRARLDNFVVGLAATAAGGEDVRELILDRLCTHVSRMASATLDEELLANLAEQGDLGAVVLAWLRRPPVNMDLLPWRFLAAMLGEVDAGPGWPERSLALLERATYDPGTVGDLGSWPIDFVRLSGANETPLAAAFPRLLEELRRTEPNADIRERLAATPPPPLSPTSKLAGNELMNFSAFLRPRWRSNDWMWGRLDAVVTLVETLIEPGRLRELATAMSTESPDDGQVELLLARFRAITTTSGTVTGTDEWSAFLLETAWEPRQDDIRTAFERLLASDPDEPPDLGPLRAALVAARQWEILAVLLPLGPNVSGADQGTPDAPPSPRQLVEIANNYWVGVETLGNPREPEDGNLVHNLTNAARTMLAKSSRGPVGKVASLLAPIVALLSRVWLHKTCPKVIAAVLLGMGVAGLTVPAWSAADDPLAAVAGPAAVLFLAGILIAVVRSSSVGFLLALIAVVVAILAAQSAGAVVLEVSASVVAFVTLMAGAGLAALIRLRPPFPR